MSGPFRIFIGYDSREPAAYHVLSHSLLTRSSIPLAITPLTLQTARRIGYTRPRGSLESTEFSMTRFLVPYLSGFSGHSLFMDCDMLCRVDIAELIPEIWGQLHKAVLVCPHDYAPKQRTKFLGQVQTAYPRKNWSSLMVFNNTQCRRLTPRYVDTATGLDLHRFEWLADGQVGYLPLEWNWLVGEYPPSDSAKILHFTNGGPWFEDCVDCDYADEWNTRAQQAGFANALVGVRA